MVRRVENPQHRSKRPVLPLPQPRLPLPRGQVLPAQSISTGALELEGRIAACLLEVSLEVIGEDGKQLEQDLLSEACLQRGSSGELA